MGKFGKNNKKYRTINKMAEDIAVVLNLDNVSYALQFDVIHGITWQWTQRNGIYKGNKLWSKNAIELYEKDKKVKLGKTFREEHIVPRKIIIDHLFNLEKPVQSEYVFNYLKKNLKSIVLTLDENKEINDSYRTKMPPDVDISKDFNEWARYYGSSIEIKFVKWVTVGRSLFVDDVFDFSELQNPSEMLYNDDL
jgi:hypothetical protein